VDGPVVDLSDPRSFRDGFPHAAFTWLRSEAPLFWHAPTARTPDGEGFWVLSRHADVLSVLQDPARFSSESGPGRELGGTQLKDDRGAGVVLNESDDPRHRRLRTLVNTGFTPRMIGRLEPELRRRTGRILDGLPRSETFDFAVAVARELPLQAICMMLGIPQDDREELCGWVDRGIEAETGEAIALDAHRKLGRYVAELIEKKRADPGDDVLSVIVHAKLGDGSGTLSKRELRAFFSLLFPAGAETTRSAISGGLLALMEQPEQWDALEGEPSLMKSAIEEIVRWTTPSAYKRRTTTRELDLFGNTIAAGDKVTVWEMSANRDERVFSDPFRFDLARSPNPHLGFGYGVHFCLGAHLARLEIRVMMEEILARALRFELAGTPVWRPNNRLVGLKSLPVRVCA
jgi:cytochrome P450